MKIRLIILLLICTTCLTGCQESGANDKINDKPFISSPISWKSMDEPYDLPQFDVKKGKYHITGAVSVESGVLKPLTKAEFLKMKKEHKIKGVSVKEKEEQYPQKYTYSFAPMSIHTFYDGAGISRITQGYKSAAEIFIQPSVYERKVIVADNIKDELRNQGVIDEAVYNKYKLYKTVRMDSVGDINTGFKPSGKYKVAAMASIPRMAIISGEYKVHAKASKKPIKEYNMKYSFPYTNDEGYLDVIFVMIESDDISSFPEF